MKLILLPLFFLIGLGMTGFGAFKMLELRDQQNSWPKTKATIVDHKYHQSTSSSGSGSSSRRRTTHNYCPVLEYKVKGETFKASGGFTISCVTDRDRSQAQQEAESQIGENRNIQYNPDKPSQMVTAGKGAYMGFMVVLGIGLAFMLFTGIAFLSALFR